ncbi:MAG: phospholipase D family protein [Flavobacteriia bacterium]|nr:phospholipase D family protein [Flavobacteriia bacterium]
MTEFLFDSKINSELQNILEKSKKKLILISPYIKLHDRLKSSLLEKKDSDKLEIIIVFGKNEEDISKSLSKEDFEFFKEFPNIKILYEKRLHAKYYANEKTELLTSMNLHSFSQNNNIEFGILNLDKYKSEASKYFERVIDQAEKLYANEPLYNGGSFFSDKSYLRFENKTDKLSQHYGIKKVKANNQSFKNNSANENSKYGFCIRTGEKIPFDPKHPFCRKAYESWARFGDENYKEKYCHFSGEPSNGETSYAKPILKKNWKKAKEIFDL